MNKVWLNQKLLSLIKIAIIAILISMPFYAFLTIFASSVIGHYTAVRLYGETILLIATIVAILLIIIDRPLRIKFFKSRIIKLMALFAGLVVIWGIGFYLKKDLSAKAFGYGLIVDLRFFLFFVISYLFSLKMKLEDQRIIKLVLSLIHI